MCLDVLSAFSDVFKMFSLDVFRIFPSSFQDVLKGSCPSVFSNGNIVLDHSKEFDDPQVSDGLDVILNESMDLSDPKDFDNPMEFQLEE